MDIEGSGASLLISHLNGSSHTFERTEEVDNKLTTEIPSRRSTPVARLKAYGSSSKSGEGISLNEWYTTRPQSISRSIGHAQGGIYRSPAVVTAASNAAARRARTARLKQEVAARTSDSTVHAFLHSNAAAISKDGDDFEDL